MPKGSVAEREVICRACGQPFLSVRVGKAAFYCHRQECDAQRHRLRLTVPNPNGRAAVAGASPLARKAMALQARQERERARFERQWRREVEAWIPRHARELELATRRRARDDERLARARARVDAAAAQLRALERATGRGGHRLGLAPAMPGRPLTEILEERHPFLNPSNRAMAEYVIEHLDDIAFGTADQVADAIGTSSSSIVRFSQTVGFDGYPDLQRAAQNEYRSQRTAGRPIVLAGSGRAALAEAAVPESREAEPRADVYDLLSRIRLLIVGQRETPADRRDVQRAVVRLAHATGLRETHDALRHLAAEALAWDLALPASVRAEDVDTQAMRDAA